MSETLYSFYRNNEEIKYNTDDPLAWVTGPRLRFNKCSPGVVLKISFEFTQTKIYFFESNWPRLGYAYMYDGD